jgi:hypothetical protein
MVLALPMSCARFSESVNQSGTMFSTDRWLLPRLERLNKLKWA